MAEVGTQIYLGNDEIQLSVLGQKPVAVNPFTFDAVSAFTLEYLVVAGGGGGGGDYGGGGGAGGFISGSMLVSSSMSFTTIVGAGGIAGIGGPSRTPGGNGNTSVFGSISAAGGGGGGRSKFDGSADGNGRAGGSGGGGGAVVGIGGAGNTPTLSPSQGNNGGTGGSDNGAGAGGGGALTVGGDGSPTTSGNSGNGGSGSLWLDGNRYAGGGGGGSYLTTFISSGGPGGGGNGGGNNSATQPTAGSANTGGGGGGASGYNAGAQNGAAGGSGIVKLRYEGTGSKAFGGTVSYDSGYTYHTFTTIATSSFDVFTDTFDPAASAFFTATGITDGLTKNAVNQLVLDLKACGAWDECDAIYPFVGGTADTHKYNLKDTSTYEITFAGSWTHNSNGITGNGTDTYADTGWNPTTVGRNTDGHMSIYSRTNYNSPSALMSDMGCGSSPAESLMALANGGTTFWIWNSTVLSNAYGNTQGHYMTRRNSSNTIGVKNGSTIVSGGTGSGYPNRNMYIGAQNTTSGAARWTNRNYAFASLGSDITDNSGFYTAVQNFQTLLARQV